ncbi:hypothetical protein FY534_08345 [Alicyclobacillus sp. TC]|nr:hypothetical protein FY534_08345 [Alicyclobacillus sp. TC]
MKKTKKSHHHTVDEQLCYTIAVQSHFSELIPIPQSAESAHGTKIGSLNCKAAPVTVLLLYPALCGDTTRLLKTKDEKTSIRWWILCSLHPWTLVF